MDFSGGLNTGGGGIEGGSSEAGGNDSVTGGGNITFGVLPALPTLGSSTLSASASLGGSSVIFLGVGTAVGLGVYLMMKKGR